MSDWRRVLVWSEFQFAARRLRRIPAFAGAVILVLSLARPMDEAIVSRAFAEWYWPGASPLGERIRPLGGRWYTIVGEGGDVRQDGLEEPPGQMVYFPIVLAGPQEAQGSLPAPLSRIVRTEAGEGETPPAY